MLTGVILEEHPKIMKLTYKLQLEKVGKSHLVFGNKKDIHNLIKNNLVTTVSNNKYKVYVVLVEYDSTLPKKFREHFLKMFNKDKTKIAKNGFYEKDMLKWLKVKDLKKNMWMFTSWYKIIVNKIYDKLK